jgi:hypothetical protein
MMALFQDFIRRNRDQVFTIALRSSRIPTTELDRPAADWKYRP